MCDNNVDNVLPAQLNKEILIKYKKILKLNSNNQTNFPNIFIQGNAGTSDHFLVVYIKSHSLQEINLQFNSWYNLGATGGSLHFPNDVKSPYLAYIVSTYDHYIKYLFYLFENRFAINTKLELENDSHNQYLMFLAKSELNKIERVRWIYLPSNDNHYHAIATHEMDKDEGFRFFSQNSLDEVSSLLQTSLS